MPLVSGDQRQRTESDSHAILSDTEDKANSAPSSKVEPNVVINEQKLKLFNEMSEKGLLAISDRIGMIAGGP